MRIDEMMFCRRFSINPYKSLRLPLSEMSCAKDWLNTSCGDPYPVTFSDSAEGNLEESLDARSYQARNTGNGPCARARLLGMHFPYATYELKLNRLTGTAGFRFVMPGEGEQPETAVIIAARREPDQLLKIEVRTIVGGVCRQVQEKEASPEAKALVVTCRCAYFDVYTDDGRGLKPTGTFQVVEFAPVVMHHRFVRSTASVYTELLPGQEACVNACSFLDGGVSQADIKCMRYEDGTPIFDDGRLYLTMSARAEQGSYQAVISWNPSSCDFRLEGAFFYDVGDDAWRADVAASVLFDRRAGLWYVWAVSSHGHVLSHAVSRADLRHGIHVLDVELMPALHLEESDPSPLDMSAGKLRRGYRYSVDDDRQFFAKSADEDPDLIYDAEHDRWLLAICRGVDLGEGQSAYRYFFFQSKEPFANFTWIGNTTEGSNTGGSFIRYEGKLYFLCGSDFDARAQYHLYDPECPEKHSLLHFNYDDGGFRGWGTLIAVPCGSRVRYMHITFDRHGGSSWRWSYGNLYVFEADYLPAADAER